jgi:hypothetical protein
MFRVGLYARVSTQCAPQRSDRKAMSVTRRNCLTLPALAAFGRRMTHAEGTAHRAIAFDAFTIVDPRAVAVRATELYPNDAGRLIELWRTRQVEDTWLRTMTKTYVDFRKTTEDSLVRHVQRASSLPATTSIS